MVAARRSFRGTLSLAALERLAPSLADTAGEVEYELEFGTDALGVGFLALHAEAPLTLICQRTLRPFVLPLAVDTRLGLIADERDEAALPGGYEALLLEDGALDPRQVIEDELLLALPLVPVSPGSERDIEKYTAGSDAAAAEPAEDNPFAVLRGLRHN